MLRTRYLQTPRKKVNSVKLNPKEKQTPQSKKRHSPELCRLLNHYET